MALIPARLPPLTRVLNDRTGNTRPPPALPGALISILGAGLAIRTTAEETTEDRRGTASTGSTMVRAVFGPDVAVISDTNFSGSGNLGFTDCLTVLNDLDLHLNVAVATTAVAATTTVRRARGGPSGGVAVRAMGRPSKLVFVLVSGNGFLILSGFREFVIRSGFVVEVPAVSLGVLFSIIIAVVGHWSLRAGLAAGVPVPRAFGMSMSVFVRRKADLL